MTRRTLMPLLLLGATAAMGQTYNPPNPTNRVPQLTVVRTEAGATTHLKVMFTVPPPHPDLPVFNEAFFYGWIEADGKRLMVSLVKGPDAPFGFPARRQPFAPGDRVTLEVDLPRAFADAVGAHLHAGIGATGKGYFPTPNLLVQK